MFRMLRITCLLLSVTGVWPAEGSSIVYRVSIPENQSNGFYVGNVVNGTNVLLNASDVVKQKVAFSPLKQDAENNKYFVIDSKTGTITTSSQKIDRELVCEFSESCILQLDITAIYQSFFAIVTTEITILDENDNAPTFSNVVNVLNISEDESIGTRFAVASAFDADTWGNNSIQTYYIEQPEPLFEIIAFKGSDKSYSFSLKLLKELDRETKEKYSLKLIVSDGGSPIRKGILEITVNVLDENDNSPVFVSDGYNTTIDENIALNSVILTLSATDRDVGRNGDVTYRFRERQSNIDTVKRLFSLNPKTGQLSVISDLTREPPEFYEFYVEAVDNGTIPRVNQTNVMITVNDVENNPPIIELNLLSPGNTNIVNIEENQPTDVFVAHVSVKDYDKGNNGNFTCMIDNKLFELETFQGQGFKIVVNGSLDREISNTQNVTVICRDYGSPPETSLSTFVVNVLDVNDNAPAFEHSIYSVELLENTIPNKPIVTVKATDIDLGENGTVEYVLFDKTGEFRIDNTTGEIYTNKSFDREKEALVVFRVLAVDHGSPRLSGTASVSVKLFDENDNAPFLVPVRPELRIAENMPPNTTVGVLTAEDKDIGINAKVTFAIASVQTTFPFIISPSGEIRTKEILDRELQGRYEIPVTVTDMGTNQLSNTQYVTIYVTDENDNAPRVTFPNGVNNTVHFTYPVHEYNVVTTVAAYDIDDGENGSLSYAIVGGNELNLFEINQELGEISIRQFIDLKQDMTVDLVIEVRDKAAVPKSTRVTLTIKLFYANSTNVLTQDNSGNKNIIITVVVIVTTVAVAVAIIGVILFLRSVDNRKARGDVNARYSDSGISTTSESLPVEDGSSDDGNLKKKKEVSFSLQFSLEGLDGGRNVESSSDMYDKMPSVVKQGIQHGPPLYTLQNQERIDSQMKALKLQQYLWEAKARTWESSAEHQLPVGDSESETSRETITCDSGRGVSEDEGSVSSPVTDEKRFFKIQEPRHKQVQFNPHPIHKHPSLPTVRESTPEHHMPPPRPYKPAGIDMNTNRNNSRLVMKNLMNPTYSSNGISSDYFGQKHPVHQTDPRRYLSNASTGKYYPRVRHDSGSSLRSNEDDGGSTTTSGSYTLDDIDIETYVSRDLVV